MSPSTRASRPSACSILLTLSLVGLLLALPLAAMPAQAIDPPDWHRGMAWTFENDAGSRSVTTILGKQNVTSAEHNKEFEAWIIRTSTRTNDSVVISVSHVDSTTWKTISSVTDVYTDGNHLRLVHTFKPTVPLPWWGAMDHDRDREIRTTVKVARIFNGQPLPPQEYKSDYGSAVDAGNTTVTVPAGTFEGVKVRTSNQQVGALMANTSKYHYVPELKYWAASYSDADDEEPSWRLVKALLTRPPVAHVTITPEVPVVGQTVTLDATGSLDPDGNVTAYRWGLDDGSHATGPVINRTWEKPGRYPVVLTVTDDENASTTRTLFVRVLKAPGELTIQGPSFLHEDKRARFHAVTSDRIVRATWDFGDGTAKAVGLDVSHTYLDPGTYNLTLRAIDDTGTASRASLTVTVLEEGEELPEGAGSSSSGISGPGGNQASNAQPDGPHIVAPGNGTLVGKAEQTFVVNLVDLSNATLLLDGEVLATLQGPGTQLTTATLPLNQGPLDVALAHEGIELDRVTLVPQASSGGPGGSQGTPGEQGADEQGDEQAEDPSSIPLVTPLVVLLLVAVAAAARR